MLPRANLSTLIPPVPSRPPVLCHLNFPPHPSLHSEKWTTMRSDGCPPPRPDKSDTPRDKTQRRKGRRSRRHARWGRRPPPRKKKKNNLILTKLHIPTRCDNIRCPSKSQISHHLLCVTHRHAHHNNPGRGGGGETEDSREGRVRGRGTCQKQRQQRR